MPPLASVFEYLVPQLVELSEECGRRVPDRGTISPEVLTYFQFHLSLWLRSELSASS